MRGTSPKYAYDRFQNPMYQMLRLDEEPAGIHQRFVEDLAGVTAKIAVVDD